MGFLRNTWYMLAWSSELDNKPMLSRMILNQPILLYRDPGDGILRAMLDRCPHRFAPLSLGKLSPGRVQCGYHGLVFNHEGRCVLNPFSKATPSAAQVAVFPVAERDGCIWIWPGDAEKMNEEEIPVIPHHIDSSQRCVFGLTTAKADYRLISDNLMDLTHTAFLHPAFGGDYYFPKYRNWEENGSIVSDYVISDVPNFLGDMLPSEKVDHQDTIRWLAPSTHILNSTTTALSDGTQIYQPSAHILTPETENSTHYFWSSAQPKDSPLPDEELHALLSFAFDQEDKPMVEAVQRSMGEADLWDLNPVLLPTDAGSVRVRRRLAALIEADSADDMIAKDRAPAVA